MTIRPDYERMRARQDFSVSNRKALCVVYYVCLQIKPNGLIILP